MKNCRTKMICTIGPATKKTEMIQAMTQSGMDIARLNFSHGSQKEHFELISNIREAAESLKVDIPIIGDLGGPKIRIGELDNQISLQNDEIIIISTDPASTTNKKKFAINYDKLHQEVNVGDRVLIDDGMIELRVINIVNTEIYCEVIVGGMVSSKKGVNLPDTILSIPALTEKDKEDIDFALSNDLDFLALSFVSNGDDILHLRQYLSERNRHIPIIAKIEKPQAVQDLENIIKNSDAIMIARGDLGVEMDPYEIPILQKKIIHKCLACNIPVITATQMLESMISKPRATRAEVSDVANAVFDGTDVVMLSAETSIGLNPVNAVKVMNSILLSAEQTDYINPPLCSDNSCSNNTLFAFYLSKAASSIAQDTNSHAIIAMTTNGRTARFLSRYRTKIPIIAVSNNHETITKLKLSWGVEAIIIDSLCDTEDFIKKLKEQLLNKGWLNKNDLVVFVSGSPIFEADEINMIKIERI